MTSPEQEQLQGELDATAAKMTDPATLRDAALMKQLAAEHKLKQDELDIVTRRDAIAVELGELTKMAEDESADLAAMAEQDKTKLEEELRSLTQQEAALMTPRDERDERDVILEIRAGAGGEEAALFAQQLYRAYLRWAENRGWKVHTIGQSQSEQGGLKEVIAEVSGRDVFGTLKFERGVHRVQRVPETEKQGRIHTSTVTVAVLPQAVESDIELKTEDLRIDTYRASGAGGQHVNKTDSAIRITHLPTGTVVAVQDERSQHKNKAKAMSILRSRILDEREEKRRREEAAARKTQVGTGDRSEKIRTYNFPQDRITDHRIKQSWSNIEAVMAGGWDDIFGALQDAAKKQASISNDQTNPKSQ